MKTKLLSTAFAMLTVYGVQSQNTITDTVSGNYFNDTLDSRPVSFPFWMVREIALDLEEKQELELELRFYALERKTFQKLIGSMEKKQQQRQLQQELLERKISILEVQLQGEKKLNKGTGTLSWSLRLLGAIGAGFLLGRL